jgi:hypothetical protein
MIYQNFKGQKAQNAKLKAEVNLTEAEVDEHDIKALHRTASSCSVKCRI